MKPISIAFLSITVFWSFTEKSATTESQFQPQQEQQPQLQRVEISKLPAVIRSEAPLEYLTGDQYPTSELVKPEKLITDIHTHQIWDELLKEHVSDNGKVDYAGLNKSRLEAYLKELEQNPVEDSWSRSQKLSYWINAYNAFTVKLILDNYPVKSIRDIDRPWGKKFIKLGDENYSLNQIEHDIVRPIFNEPRIHFALVCAAISCPKLLNQAYLPKTLNEQLDQQSRYFINESGKNQLNSDHIKISKLFKWYEKDFTNQGNLIDFLNQYSNQRISQKAKVEFLDYDWSLNG
ncbi:MAG: hypothetical protein DHS20C17_26410 [Cyclobacteriaceae bacterium]|nr:MAG: hypothetical protein DHS20C17_26410 [Cyclobacteriaceae bacterium]